ncbi:MAG: Fe-S cluster assembly sulfur transfer protein SufU [Patescibacteria group bacterium]
MTDTLYREELMEHYKHPQNWGRLTNKSGSVSEVNPLCGDEITVDVLVEEDVLKDISFTAHGCAISIASASIFFDKVKGKKLEDIKSLQKKDLLDQINPNLTLSRIKCATLGFNALSRLMLEIEARGTPKEKGFYV